MSPKSNKQVRPQSAPAPVQATAPAEPKAKQPRYVKSTWGDDHVINLKVGANPKRAHGVSYQRFALHKSGQTVGQYVQACISAPAPVGCKKTLALSDLRWDVAHGFIEIVPPVSK